MAAQVDATSSIPDLSRLVDLRYEHERTEELADQVVKLRNWIESRVSRAFKPKHVEDLTREVQQFDAGDFQAQVAEQLENAYVQVASKHRIRLPSQLRTTNVTSEDLKGAPVTMLERILQEEKEAEGAQDTGTPLSSSRIKNSEPERPAVSKLESSDLSKLTAQHLQLLDRWLEYREWRDSLVLVQSLVKPWETLWEEGQPPVVRPEALIDGVKALKKAISQVKGVEADSRLSKPPEGSLEALYYTVSEALDSACDLDGIVDTIRSADPSMVKEIRDGLQQSAKPDQPPSSELPPRRYPWLLLAAGLAFALVAFASTDRLRGVLKRISRATR